MDKTDTANFKDGHAISHDNHQHSKPQVSCATHHRNCINVSMPTDEIYNSFKMPLWDAQYRVPIVDEVIREAAADE